MVQYTTEEIAALLKRVEDETFDRTRGGQDNIGKTIAAFATMEGGLLLVGQDDLKNGGAIVGIVEEDFHKEFSNAIANVQPAPLCRIDTVSADGKKLAIVTVQDIGALRPCSYNGVFYARKGHSSPQLKPDEIKRYHLFHGTANVEDMPSHATRIDLDIDELAYYESKLQKSKTNIVDSISSPKGALTSRGVIVLANKPSDFVEGAFIEIQKYENTMGAVPAPVGSTILISKPARQMIEETVSIIEQNLPVIRVYEGAKMFQSPAVSVSIIRETITNAVVHRNYRSHEHIRVRIYADGFDVSNPAAITQQMWHEIQAANTTYHPNEGLYTFLNPVLLYEGRGEGIWKIREELRRMGKASPEFKVIGDSPSVFYARINLSPAKVREAKLLKLMSVIEKKGEMTSSDAMHLLNVSRVTAIKLLNSLVKIGTLQHEGNTRTSRYLLRAK